ncbi:hypothetical protein MUK42_27363, partial [Musa troglodytarum]
MGLLRPIKNRHGSFVLGSRTRTREPTAARTDSIRSPSPIASLNKGNEIKDGDKTMAVVVLGVQGLVVVEDEGEDEVGDVMKGMQRTRASAAAAATDPEPANPHEHEEQVALDDPEELMEDKVEYEEVEKEVEEKEEEVVEEELEEEEQETDVANVSNAGDAAGGDASMVEGEKDDDESKKHAELLALPPNGSEIYVGGIPRDASEEELRSFCEPNRVLNGFEGTQEHRNMKLTVILCAIFFAFLVAKSCVFSSLCRNISLSEIGDVLDCSLAKPPSDNKR